MRVSNKKLYGVGVKGLGNFCSRSGGKITREYAKWEAMLNRVYSGNYKNYNDCFVAEEWHNFQNFAEWITKLPQWKFSDWQIDKDISKSRIYSNETCFLVPKQINTIFQRYEKRDLPRGVRRDKGAYVSSWGWKETRVSGYFKDVPSARNWWLSQVKNTIDSHISTYGKDMDQRCVELILSYDLEEL